MSAVKFVVCLLVFVICSGRVGVAQAPATLQVQVVHDKSPLSGATVRAGGESQTTDVAGRVTVTVPPGAVAVTAQKDGFLPATITIAIAPGARQSIVIEMTAAPMFEEVVTVAATRTGARVDDQPMRVEVLGREEIEEKLLMTPGDIVMLLNEMGGMRVQTTSPSMGAASVRIQGMRGRYTRFFSDGLPLFGAVGGLGLLQIPPMDLGQVEVIKGVASSLYGAGAMGGVVNLVSRRPGDDAEREVLINQSTRGATDVVGWLATRATPAGWSATMLAGGHWQRSTDVNSDAWADLPHYARAVLRPRVFWEDGRGRSFFATVGVTAERRRGGTTGATAPGGSGVTYRESLGTRRIDGGAVAQALVGERVLISARGALSFQRHDHEFGDVRERDRHDTAFGEVTARATLGRAAVVAGAAIEREGYRPRDVPRFAYTAWVPGVFGQADVELAPWISVSGSGRIDRHSRHGTFISPRLAALVRSGRWSSRLSVGTGFFGASPLTEETEATGLAGLVVPAPLRAEEGRSASVDISRTDGPASYSLTVFRSRVAHPLHVDRGAGLVLTNLPEAASTTGMELRGLVRRGAYALTASYTYVRAQEVVGGTRQDVPLTPRHSAGVVGMWEREEVGRVGIEVYYTGRQRLEENPFRGTSLPYVIVGLLVERQLGRIRLFVNGENLTGVRQTQWDPLVRPSRAPDGRWTVDAWAPLDGRNINGGLRWFF